MFDADHAILPGPVPRHPGHRASEAHPVQEVGGRRGGAERPVQLRLPVFLLATRAAEGRGVLDTMAVSNLPSEMRRVPKYRNFRSLSLGVLGIVNFKTSRYTYFEQ